MTLFALWYVHPVRDGNGHLGRMLACAMLAGCYATPTLLAFVSQMQAKRAEVSRAIVAIVRGQEDLGPFVYLFLATLQEAIVDMTDRVVPSSLRSCRRPSSRPTSRGTWET